MTGDDQSAVPLAKTKVVLDESGSEGVTDDNGRFHLFLPEVLRSDDEVTITVTAPGFAVYEPAGGKLRIPSDPRRVQFVIRLLPKGSLKFFSDAQLRAFLEASARDASRQADRSGSKEAPDTALPLKDWATQHGFSVDQVRAELDRWALNVSSRAPSTYERSLVAFAKNNFREAKDRALDAAAEEEARLGATRKREQDEIGRTIRAYRLAGDAAFNGLDFTGSARAYGKAIQYVDRNRDALRWADLQLGIGNSEERLIARSEGAEMGQHSQFAIAAYELALEVYKKETLPEKWATTQNNLGITLQHLAKQSEGAQTAAYLVQSVAAYQAALQVYTAGQSPLGWAMVQQNLGSVLMDVAEQTERREAVDNLRQSVVASRSALTVYTIERFPGEWAACETI